MVYSDPTITIVNFFQILDTPAEPVSNVLATSSGARELSGVTLRKGGKSFKVILEELPARLDSPVYDWIHQSRIIYFDEGVGKKSCLSLDSDTELVNAFAILKRYVREIMPRSLRGGSERIITENVYVSGIGRRYIEAGFLGMVILATALVQSDSEEKVRRVMRRIENELSEVLGKVSVRESAFDEISGLNVRALYSETTASDGYPVILVVAVSRDRLGLDNFFRRILQFIPYWLKAKLALALMEGSIDPLSHWPWLRRRVSDRLIPYLRMVRDVEKGVDECIVKLKDAVENAVKLSADDMRYIIELYRKLNDVVRELIGALKHVKADVQNMNHIASVMKGYGGSAFMDTRVTFGRGVLISYESVIESLRNTAETLRRLMELYQATLTVIEIRKLGEVDDALDILSFIATFTAFLSITDLPLISKYIFGVDEKLILSAGVAGLILFIVTTLKNLVRARIEMVRFGRTLGEKILKASLRVIVNPYLMIFVGSVIAISLSREIQLLPEYSLLLYFVLTITLIIATQAIKRRLSQTYTIFSHAAYSS